MYLPSFQLNIKLPNQYLIMNRILKLSTIVFFLIVAVACGKKMTFEEQITNDVVSKMGTGICDSIPAGSTIKNVKIGEITPIGETGLVDVSLEFDFEKDQTTTHKKGAVLYSKQGSTYYLEALGGCEYDRKK